MSGKRLGVRYPGIIGLETVLSPEAEAFSLSAYLTQVYLVIRDYRSLPCKTHRIHAQFTRLATNPTGATVSRSWVEVELD